MDNEQIIRQFMKERFVKYRDDLGHDDSLEDVVDSLGLFELLNFIEQKFAIVIPDDEFSPDVFSCIGNILKTIELFMVNSRKATMKGEKKLWF